PSTGDGDRPVSRPGDAPAYLLYTSGSTGNPKGVLVSRPALDRYLADVRGMFELTRQDRVLQFASPGFDVAIEEVFGALAAGAAVVVRPPGPVPAAELMAHCERSGVTVLSVPTSYLPLITEWGHRRRLPAAIRLAVVGGQQLDPDVLAAWAATGIPLWNMYGPTEATISAVAARLTGPPTGRVPIGAALPSARAYVLDPSGRPQPDYLPGEICLGGACLADGYVGADGSAAFRPDPFAPRPGTRMYRTGDLGWTRSDGQLVYLGRLDDQAKVRGFRVELGEIEAALRSDPGVREAMAAVTGQEQIVAAITRDDGGAGFDADATRAALARRLPRYMVPAAVRCLPQLPYTPSGKPNRAALATAETPGGTGQPAGQLSQVSGELSQLSGEVGQPAGGLAGSAAEIADIWQSLLGRRPSTVEDDFFAAGGHSLLALRLLDLLAADLGAQLTVTELFAASRLRDLAALVDQRRSDATVAAAAIPLIPHDPDPTGPATPAQARLWYAEQAAPSGAYNLALRVDFDEPVLPTALDAAVSALAARHPTLRTLLAATGDGCGQHVQPPPARVLRWVDLSDATSRDAAGQLLDAVLAADAGRPFELAVEHPYRAVAVSLAPDRHVLQLTFHHSAVDGLSIPIIRRDLAEGYRLALRGCPPVSTPAEPSYLDHARWAAARPGRAELLERLTATLDGAPADIALPYDRTGPHTDPARGALVAFPLPPGTLRVVDELAATQDSTRFAVLAAAWCAFLSRLSRQDDLVIGTPLANRTNPVTAGLVGCFVNTLPLRVRVPGESSWAELASATGGAVAELLELQDVALDEVVSRRRQQTGGDPLPFQTCFVVQEGEDAGVRPQWSAPRRWPVKFDLALSLEVRGEAMQAFLEGRSDRLDDATVELWARWFVA
ncbi:MAG: hypothetical protein QOE53_1212, partial [Pseudonocardiales bacterium]|nr:hypothetical protein [Pseudonocardiales bacterium]